MAGIVGCLALNVCECACCCACACCKTIFNATLSQVARIGHLLIVVGLFTFAVIIGQSAPQDINNYNGYSKIELDKGCDKDYEDECIYRQLIYRASFVLFLLFGFLSLAASCNEYTNRSFWVIKFAFAFLVFFGFWWGDNDFFSGWAQFARFFSFGWLLIQALLLLDFAYDCHDVILYQIDESSKENETASKGWKIFYLVLCLGCLVAAIVGLVALFQDYSDCTIGAFFSSVTIIFGVLTTIISCLDIVNKGFLTPCIMFAYSVFMCWYSLLSNPNKECNPNADTNNGDKDTALVVISIVTGAVLLYCVVNGSIVLNIFNPDGEGVMSQQHIPSGTLSNALSGGKTTTSQPIDTESPGSSDAGAANPLGENSGTAHERFFFHILMMMVSCYGAMILTNWGKPYGEPEGYGSDKTPLMSMWLKILSQWIFLAMQWRVLYVAYTDNSP